MHPRPSKDPLTNARAAKAADYPEAIELVRQGMIRLGPLVTHVEPLSELVSAIGMLKDNSVEFYKL